MKSRTKKRIASITALVVVLGGLIAAYFFLSGRQETTEEKTSAEEYIPSGKQENTEEKTSASDYIPSYTVLVSEKSENIKKLSFSYGGSDELEFTYADYRWTYTGDADFPVDNDQLNDMASAFSSISAEREIEKGDSGEYGLGDGALVIKAEYDVDGASKTYELTVGDLNSYNSYTYIKNVDGKVYMFSDSLKEKFAKSLNDLIKLDDPEADVDTNYLVSLDVSDKDKRTNVVDDTAGMRAFLEQTDAYTCLDWVKYAMTDDEFRSYGIGADSARVTIRYKAAHSVTDSDGNASTIREEEAYEIIFGDEITAPDENGADARYIYYTVTGSTILYKAPISDYEDTMKYLDYVPEETEAASEAATDAGTSADTETQSAQE